MDLSTVFTRQVGIEYPIIGGAMAGKSVEGIKTVEPAGQIIRRFVAAAQGEEARVSG